MSTFAFISRHAPTDSQIRLASEQGIRLIHMGDRDAFTFGDYIAGFIADGFSGVIVVHAQSALTAFARGLSVGVFNNVNRAAVGATPAFETTGLIVTYANAGYHCDTCANGMGEYCGAHRN